MLDATGFRLLNAWQRDFPLVPRPFAAIAADCGLEEDDVLARFAQLRSRGLIDRIAPVFRPNTVGASTLAAMRVPPERLARVAAQVSAHAGVNHNYERDNPVNLWFVATAPSPAALQWTLAGEGAFGFTVMGTITFSIGLGFLISAGASYWLASRLGVLEVAKGTSP